TVQGGKAHSHYCHRAFCPICQRIQTAQNVKKFLPVMKYLASEGREFYFVTLTLQNCVTDDARVLRAFMRRCNRMWADGIRTKHKFRSLGISGVIKKECTYHVVKKDLFSFHYHFHIIVDSLEAAKYVGQGFQPPAEKDVVEFAKKHKDKSAKRGEQFFMDNFGLKVKATNVVGSGKGVEVFVHCDDHDIVFNASIPFDKSII
ncbi:DUF1672 family protein, partial [Rhizobium leguminosarum]|uniref:DUF1672 family protein n=1 Tax=Rhizobium leguminosarum TaxID=384 RepID=UPI00197DCC11